MASSPAEFDCLVVGAGPAGLAAAVALAEAGTSVAVAGRLPPGAHAPAGTAAHAGEDTRTAALLPPVIDLLRNLHVWEAVAPVCTPLLGIRIIDDTGHILRAPTVTFSAADVGMSDLGYNVPNGDLARVLARRVAALEVPATPCNVVSLAIAPDAVTAALEDGTTVSARLVVGADGRNSVCRAAAGIEARRWTYDQTAIAVRFAHSRPHRGLSTELHRPAGPCTSVPLPGLQSSLVWVERPAEAERLTALSDAAFLGSLEERFGDVLGSLSGLGQRRSFPLTGLLAGTLARDRVALVGEAGHVIPPIGAQGLNLGMFDVASLVDTVAAAHREGRDIGGAEVIAGYARQRADDVRRRIGAVDLLNRSLTSGLLPFDLVRGAGLHLLAAMPALRRRVMSAGLFPPGPLPTSMQPSPH